MEWTSDGKLVPTIAKMNGQNGNKYKTLLTEKFDAYYVEGYVTATSKGGTLKNDEVNFGIAKSEKYDNTDFDTDEWTKEDKIQTPSDFGDPDPRIKTGVKVGDTDAADYEGVYAAAIIMVDEYDDLVILSFQPSGKNKTFKFDADLYDEDENEDFASGKVKYLNIFASESATKTTRYNLETKDDAVNVTLYKNGSKTENATAKDIHDALIAAVGDVELVDTYKTNGYYDALYVNTYETAQVDTVLTSQNKIIFNNKSTKKSLTLDPDDDKLVYNIYYNGEKIDFAGLKKDDVLSIASTNNDDFSQSKHFDIYVSRTVETGKLTGISESDKTVTIGGKEYKFVGGYDKDIAKSENLGNEYTVYEDYFGRIFDAEINASTAKYAVIDKAIYNSSDENLRLTMYTADGGSKVLVLDGTNAKILVDGTEKTFTAEGDKTKKQVLEKFVKGKIYLDSTDPESGRQSIDTRVAKYKVSSSTGRVTMLDFVEGTKGEGTYKASTGAIGSVKIGDATKVIDAIKYSTSETPEYTDLAIASRNSFAADTDYVVYGYGEKVDGYHPFVLATEGEGYYNAETRFAVVAGSISTAKDDAGEDIYKIPALYFDAKETDNTVVKELIGSDELDADEVDKLVEGNIIVFTTDANGYIDDYEVIFKQSKDISVYDNLVEMALIDNNDTELFGKVIALPSKNASDKWVASWDASVVEDGTTKYIDEPIQLIFGPVVTSNSKSFGIGKINDWKTDLNKNHKEVAGVYEIDLDSDTAVYEYDYSQSKKNRLSVASAASIRASIIVNNNNNEDIIDWAYNSADEGKEPSYDNKKNVNFAFALVVDGTARDVLVFNAK